MGHYNLLTGDLFQIGNRVVDDLLVTDRFADTHVEGDLGNARNFHHVLELKFFLQLGRDFLPINFF